MNPIQLDGFHSFEATVTRLFHRLPYLCLERFHTIPQIEIQDVRISLPPDIVRKKDQNFTTKQKDESIVKIYIEMKETLKKNNLD